MTKINVNLKEEINNSYEIQIGTNLTEQIIKDLKEKALGSKYAIITDVTVQKFLGMKFKKELRAAGIKCDIFAFYAGEEKKTLATLRKLATEMIRKGYNRSDCIIALGGGVVGDMAGFLASIFMRGIPFIQVPTSLLAMVDSSVGGKTGLDLDIGKNLIGTFYQPKKVYIDIEYLKTLPKKHITNGLAEVIKYGCIYDKKFFEYLEENIEKVFELNNEVLEKIINRSCEIKASVVEKDEKESGLRMILNYGHTYGHAIESLSNYKILHGHAVSMGICKINQVAVEKNSMKQEDADRIKNLLIKANLPTKIPERFKEQSLQKEMQKDKKVKDGNIRFAVVPEIGKAIIKGF